MTSFPSTLPPLIPGSRELSDAERASIEQHIAGRHPALRDSLRREGERSLRNILAMLERDRKRTDAVEQRRKDLAA